MWCKLSSNVLAVIVVLCSCQHFTHADDFEQSLGHIRPKTSAEVQKKTAEDLIKRILPEHADQFAVEVDLQLRESGRDVFKLLKSASTDRVQITGSSGLAVAWGFHHYLKYSCNCHISWEVSQLKVPQPLPLVNLTITSNDRFRYYQNVCTPSYSFAWWDWPQWERHIDWMALNGFNMPLAFTGQEAIWHRVYLQLNMTVAEINEHFTGPAFLAWQRMGNLRGFAGPLSDHWHQSRIDLQKRILERMRNLGITPVLPAFSGHVPRAFKRIFPNAKMEQASHWNRFTDEYCCPYIIDPTDPLFQQVGSLFMKTLIDEFGTDHLYNCDTFNEMRPKNETEVYLKIIGQSIYHSMTAVDSGAIWVLQNWLFVYDSEFWTEARAQALLTSVPLGKMIVLDLQAEQSQQYGRLKSYFGQPFIWCMLHNFGGTLGFSGSMDIVNQEALKARQMNGTTMIGTGLTPEGINQNYIVYDLMMENSWRQAPVDMKEWVSAYLTRRYGQAEIHTDNAWQILKSGILNYKGAYKFHGMYTVNIRPSFKINLWNWYNLCDIFNAWDEMMAATETLGSSAGYRHDLVDMTRQALQVLGDLIYKDLRTSFQSNDTLNFQKQKDAFLLLLSDMDTILGTSDAFLLGNWLKLAKALANSSEEEKLFEYNARNQITLWGPTGEICDYANKQWAGILSNYSRPRWDLFLSAANESLVSESTFDDKKVTARMFTEVEEPFTFDRTIFPDVPQGDVIAIARNIHDRWAAEAKKMANCTVVFSIGNTHMATKEQLLYQSIPTVILN